MEIHKCFWHNNSFYTVPKHIKHTEKYKIDNKQEWYSFTVLVYLMYYNISLQNLPFQLISKQIVHTKYEADRQIYFYHRGSSYHQILEIWTYFILFLNFNMYIVLGKIFPGIIQYKTMYTFFFLTLITLNVFFFIKLK